MKKPAPVTSRRGRKNDVTNFNRKGKTTMTHTEGRWHVQRNGKRVEVVTEDTMPIACVNRRYDNSPLEGASTDARTANAYLIAAAPDLLAVAERVVAGGMSYPKHDRELAAAAIAKARGEA